MLVLSRKKGQSVIIQDDIEITILETEGDTVKLGITAPRQVPILRKELLVSVQETNRESAGQQADLLLLSDELKKFKKNL
jgi:carbon storage regulator